MTEKLNTSTCHASVTSTGQNLKWDHFEILAKGRSLENLRAAACKDREFAVNDQILRIALILPKNPHW